MSSMDEAAPNTPPLTTTPTAWPPVAVPGQPTPAEPDPAPPSEGAKALESLLAQIRRYVVLPSEEAFTAVTLWVAATHLQTAWQHAPRLAIVGPAKRCGKSRLLDMITETVHDPLITVNASAAAVFRSITENPPTLLVDEADTLFGSAKVAEKNEEMRGLLNAGHQRNRPTLRVSGPNHEVSKFPTFAMAAIAGIGDLPDTIMDRAAVIRMRRRRPGEKVAEFRTVRDTPALHAKAMELVPSMPVEDRAADTWEPLIAIADLAGGPWPRLARAACLVMTKHEAEQDQDNSGLSIRLLVDIRRAFATEGDPPVIRTARLLDVLNKDDEAPLAGLHRQRSYRARPANPAARLRHQLGQPPLPRRRPGQGLHPPPVRRRLGAVLPRAGTHDRRLT